MRVAGEGVQDQDGVGFGRVQFAVGFVGYVDGRKSGAAIERKRIKPGKLGLGDHDGRLAFIVAFSAIHRAAFELADGF